MGDTADWRASPLHAADHSGIADALVITAEFDVLHDDGLQYAEALRRAGVDYAGMIHGFFGLAPQVDGAVAAQKGAIDALRTAFGNGCSSTTGDLPDPS